MRTVIYYFSATGNSLMVARDIAGGLDDARIVPISEVQGEEPDFYEERIGIVFPVYMWGIPAIVSRFIGRMNISDAGKYVFAVATYKAQQGDALRMLQKRLKSRGLELSAGFNVNMPGNNVIYYAPDGEEEMAKKFELWRNRLDKVINVVKNLEKYGIERGSIITRTVGTGLLHRPITATFAASDRNFEADSSCTACGMCARLCPVGNIQMHDGKPTWQHRCELCTACINRCPAGSIQYGKTTQKRERYSNPLI